MLDRGDPASLLKLLAFMLAGSSKSIGDNAGLYIGSLFIFLSKKDFGLFRLDDNGSSNIEVGEGSLRDRTAGDGEDAELDVGESMVYEYCVIKG